jgi:hypothetical protein
MAMLYAHHAIGDDEVPRSVVPLLQHLLDTYASETNKTVSVWRAFAGGDLPLFAEFLAGPEPPPAEVVPPVLLVNAAADRLVALARPRLAVLATREAEWWQERVPFFDVVERVWIFWRRVLHTTHHRTQLTVYLRVMGRPVPATYGPTADVTWEGADPTHSVAAAGRR